MTSALVAVFDPANPASWIQAGGIVVAVMVVLWLFTTGKIVTGRDYERAIQEREDYKSQLGAVHDRLEGEVFSTLKATAIALATANDIVRGVLARDRGGGRSDGRA